MQAKITEEPLKLGMCAIQKRTENDFPKSAGCRVTIEFKEEEINRKNQIKIN